MEYNYLAILVAGVATMVIGAIWYGPLFGKPWMKEMGWDPSNQEQMAKMKKGMAANYFQAFILALVNAGVLVYVFNAFNPASISAGLVIAFWLWLGLQVPLKYGDKLWNRQSFQLFFINAAYQLVVILVMTAILFSWK